MLSIIRRFAWLMSRRIHLGRKVFVADTAKLALRLDGWKFKGTIRIGRITHISEGVLVAPYGGSVSIGQECFVGPYSVLYGHGGLKIGRGTLIAAHCVIVSSNHVFESTERQIRLQGERREPISIGDDVWLGAGVKVLAGVTVGDGCVVGAGAVVTKSLPPGSVALGVPAKVIRNRFDSSPECSREQAVALTRDGVPPGGP